MRPRSNIENWVGLMGVSTGVVEAWSSDAFAWAGGEHELAEPPEIVREGSVKRAEGVAGKKDQDEVQCGRKSQTGTTEAQKERQQFGR